MHFNDDLPGIFSDITKIKTSVFDADGILTHKLSGIVVTAREKKRGIIFEEILQWESGTGPEMNSKNTYRWALTESGTIKLEHLRFGRENPVFLVEFEPTASGKWETIVPHNCNNDLYSARLEIHKDSLLLSWNVKGPAENYSLKTIYSRS